jgi:hypothetical protein
MGEEFTVKDILEMMIQFKTDVKGLQTEMVETKNLLKAYNGHREKIMSFEIDCFSQLKMTQS